MKKKKNSNLNDWDYSQLAENSKQMAVRNILSYNATLNGKSIVFTFLSTGKQVFPVFQRFTNDIVGADKSLSVIRFDDYDWKSKKLYNDTKQFEMETGTAYYIGCNSGLDR